MMLNNFAVMGALVLSQAISTFKLAVRAIIGLFWAAIKACPGVRK